MIRPACDSSLNRRDFTAAVEKFSRKHDLHQLDSSQRFYRDLLPSSAPGPGQQYAFEVDLDKCTGCKACVTACHSENGLEEDETWRGVGLVQGGISSSPVLQHVTSACHHCLSPACMSGCPTQAYVKDETTGVVKHLDDQCFGCQYCILKCPYDVPKYSKKKGIVHKCDMCIGRLTAGQPPACARACPNGAIRIVLVETEQVRKDPQEFVKIPDAPASDYTLPTTRYKSSRRWPTNMASLDYHDFRPEHSHLPLVFMLTLTQLSVGAFLANALLQEFLAGTVSNVLSSWQVLSALFIGLLALGSSLMHLGRPQYFYRAMLGLKTSWLSREILAFAAFSHLAVFYAVCALWPAAGGMISGLFGDAVFGVLRGLVVVSGLAGIYCSVKVYKDTRRPFWDTDHTTIKFFLTMGMLGFATVLFISLAAAAVHPDLTASAVMAAFGRTFLKVILVFSAMKLLVETTVFFHLTQGDLSFIKKTAILMTRPLKNVTRWRFALGMLCGVIVPGIWLAGSATASAYTLVAGAGVIFAGLLAGEGLERYLFFRAVVALKMPGGAMS